MAACTPNLMFVTNYQWEMFNNGCCISANVSLLGLLALWLFVQIPVKVGIVSDWPGPTGWPRLKFVPENVLERMACVIFTTSPIKCQLVFKNMAVTAYTKYASWSILCSAKMLLLKIWKLYNRTVSSLWYLMHGEFK